MSFPDEISKAAETPVPVLSLDGSASPVPVMALPLEKARFCRTCGARWEVDWHDCLPCAARNTRAQAQPLTVASECRAMKSSLWLYFSLLFACALGLGLSGRFGGVPLEIGVSAAISVITITWCLASVKSVLAPLRKLAGPGWFAVAVGLSLPTYGIAIAVIHGLDAFMHAPNDSMSKPFFDAGYGWLMVIAVTCVQPAVIEELAFRGVIFAGLTKALSGMETIMVTALMFMILHLSPARFPHTLALGIGAGFLRYRTKSIYPCMLMHFSHNLLCVAGEWMTR